MNLLLLVFLLALVVAKDYYAILGLDKGADEKSIKLAYRQLSKKYHPDKNPSEEAHLKFIEIGEAYEVLSDPDKKANYDRYGTAEAPVDHGDFGDMFQQFFGGFGGGGHQRQGKRRGDNTQVNVRVSLVDFYRGRDVEFDVEMRNICDICDGSGSEDGQRHTCDKCQGSGFMKVTRRLAPGMVQTFSGPCDECGGKGTKIERLCKHCGGHGAKPTPRHYNVYMGPGFERDGTQVLEGEGDQNPDWVPGDLIVSIGEDFGQSWGYRRIGRNLYRTEVLSANEAMHGGWRRVIPFFDVHDEEVEISRPKGATVLRGEKEIVHGRGMPVGDDHGDLFIEYVVVPAGGAASVKDEL